MQRKLVKGVTILSLCLMMTLTTGCESLSLLKSESPTEAERPTDICTADISTFTYTDEELEVLSRRNKENALQVNCTLYEACDYEIPDPSKCEPE